MRRDASCLESRKRRFAVKLATAPSATCLRHSGATTRRSKPFVTGLNNRPEASDLVSSVTGFELTLLDAAFQQATHEEPLQQQENGERRDHGDDDRRAQRPEGVGGPLLFQKGDADRKRRVAA
jgi:hypothetical protein